MGGSGRSEAAADVVVLGSGAAGLGTAVAAAEAGMDVVVLEKHGLLGGGTACSLGLIWVGDNHLERDAGIADARSDVHDYMRYLAGGQGDEARMSALVESAPVAMEALARGGISLQIVEGVTDHFYGLAPGGTATGRTLEAAPVEGSALGPLQDVTFLPDTPYRLSATELIAWGGFTNVDRWDRSLIAERADADLRGLGAGLVAALLARLVALGVPVRTGAEVRSLDEREGRIVGVELATGERIEARRGVMLATGGYESAPALLAKMEGLPGVTSQFPSELPLHGDALVLGGSHGALVGRVRATTQIMLTFRVPASEAGPSYVREAGNLECTAPHTMVVNRFGRRFGNEAHFQFIAPRLTDFDTATHTFSNLPCYLVFDQQYVDGYSFAGLPAGSEVPGWVARGETVEELAGALAIDPDGLAASVARFNQFAREGVDEDFGRGSELWKLARTSGRTPAHRLGTIAQPPFYGLRLDPSIGSSSGLSVDASARVRHVRGEPIPGLYAAGVATHRDDLGVGYQAGLTIASGLTFGYLAARDMAGEAAARS